MAAPRLLPPIHDIKTMVRKGMTHQEIADQFGVTRPAVTRRMSLEGNSAPSAPRYRELLPWPLGANTMDYDARMLRAEGRLRSGGKLTGDVARKHAAWRERLLEEDCVIVYHDGELYREPRREMVARYGPPAREYDNELIYVSREQAKWLKSR